MIRYNGEINIWTTQQACFISLWCFQNEAKKNISKHVKYFVFSFNISSLKSLIENTMKEYDSLFFFKIFCKLVSLNIVSFKNIFTDIIKQNNFWLCMEAIVVKMFNNGF